MKSIKQYNWGAGAAVLILLMGVIYELHRWDGLRSYDLNTKFHEDWFGHSGNIKVITSTIWEAAVLVLLTGRIYDVCRWDDLGRHDAYSVGTTDDRDFLSTPLRWLQVSWYIHEV
jgi:hypothetical protein